jgi:hypothetical protein
MDESLKPNYYALLLAILKPRYTADKCMNLMGVTTYSKQERELEKELAAKHSS